MELLYWFESIRNPVLDVLMSLVTRLGHFLDDPVGEADRLDQRSPRADPEQRPQRTGGHLPSASCGW